MDTSKSNIQKETFKRRHPKETLPIGNIQRKHPKGNFQNRHPHDVSKVASDEASAFSSSISIDEDIEETSVDGATAHPCPTISPPGSYIINTVEKKMTPRGVGLKMKEAICKLHSRQAIAIQHAM